jgi:hypothetical protein
MNKKIHVGFVRGILVYKMLRKKKKKISLCRFHLGMIAGRIWGGTIRIDRVGIV